MTRLAELDVACEALNLDDLQALAVARREGLSVRELCELIDRRIARRAERRVVDVSVRAKLIRERHKTDRQRPEAALVREAWRKNAGR